MSDDLVKRLRNWTGDRWLGDDYSITDEAAARIEELEAEVEEWKQTCVRSIVTLILDLGVPKSERANLDTLFVDIPEILRTRGEG